MSATLYGEFNVTDDTYGYALIPDDTTKAAQNTEFLQNWVLLLLGLDPNDQTSPTLGQGGTLQFPVHKGTYYFAGTVYVCAPTSESTIVPSSIIFVGTGQASKDAPVLQQTIDADLFYVDNDPGSDRSVGGVTFQDLSITYSNPSTQTYISSAIRVAPPPSTPPANIGALNVRIFRVHFQDCPAAVTVQNGGRTHIVETSVVSTAHNLNTKYGLIIGDPVGSGKAVETYIADCYLQTDTANTGQTGVAVYDSEHVRMMNTRIEAFQYGLVIAPSMLSNRGHFENVSIREYVTGFPVGGTPNGGALVIRPPSGGAVQETAFVNCEFGPSDSTMTPTEYNQAGVTIDTSGGTVDVLRFVSCTSIGWHGPGLQIISGAASNCAHVEILGGEYSANGQPLGSATINKLGIMIGGVGTPSNSIANVRIAGISCLGSVLGETAYQNYGIYVGDGVDNVIISDCDLTGNVDGAASIGSGGAKATNVFIRACNVTGYSASTAFQFNNPGTGLAITDCAGYNDQGTALGTGALPAGQVTISSATLKYYGPVALYVPQTTVTHILINAEDTGLTWGTIMLPPGGATSATIKYSAAPALNPIGM